MNFKSTPQTGGAGNFLKLQDQEVINGIIRGEPYEFYALWKNGRSEVVPEGTPKASFRFRINVIVNENNKMIAKIWEQGATTYLVLKELHDEYDLRKTLLKIKRDGTGTDTTYSILPKKESLTHEQIAKVNAIPLEELAHTDLHKTDEDNMPKFDQSEDLPF